MRARSRGLRPTTRTLLAAQLAVAVLLALWLATSARADQLAGQVSASSETTFQITSVDTTKLPTVRIAFTKDDTDPHIPQLSIEENGKKVGNVNAFPGKIGQYESDPVNVIMLAIDTSLSMDGARIAAARAAASQLLAQARPGDRIGLVAFGDQAQVVVKPTEDLTRVQDAINNMQLTQGTMLFDGVDQAEHAFPKDATRRVVVLLSDGADTGSKTTKADVQKYAEDHEVEVYSVGLQANADDGAVMAALANSSGGEYQSVADTSQLSSVYAALGRNLLRGYWLEYQTSQPGGEAVKIVVHAKGYDDATHSYVLPAVQSSDGAIHLTPPPAAKPPKPAFHLPAGTLGKLLASLPFGLLLAFLSYTWIVKRTTTTLEDRIAPYVRQRDPLKAASGDETQAQGLKAMAQPLLGMFDSALGKSGLFARFRFLLEQANIPLKESELLLMMLVGGAFGGIFGLIFGLFTALLFGVGGLMAPYMWLSLKARKRKKQFELQLADVLGTIAASLKAGHSFNQALASIAKETPDPTRHEINRVMTEARLGMPLEYALDAMAQRMGSADFDFAVTTVAIQRTVGGSLAEILEMVSDTVRGRQQFRKKVKALTSMGTMSAYVLLGMPIFMAGILFLMNRTYMHPLFFTQTGHYMMGAGAFLMFLGWFACNKIVSIKI